MRQEFKSKRKRIFVVVAITMIVCTLVFALREDKVAIDQANPVDRPARIHPDYSGTVIPPNIAPLNFSILEKGSHYCVRISSKQTETIEILSKTPKITIPKNSLPNDSKNVMKLPHLVYNNILEQK